MTTVHRIMVGVGSALVALAVLGHVGPATAQPTVSTELIAPWAKTPLVMEASELAGFENGALFWDFVNEFAGTGNLSPTKLRDKILEFAAKRLTPLTLEIYKAEIAANAASVAVEAHLQVSRGRWASFVAKNPGSDCSHVFYEVNGRITCDLGNVDEIASEPPTERIEIDHLHPASPLGKPVVVLHGHISEPAFKEAHTQLVAAATAGKVQYLLRHHNVLTGNEQPLRLSGYGVELDVKKMDYVAKDDTKIADDGSETAARSDKSDSPDEHGGFVFKTLRELHPGKAGELDKFKEHVLSTTAVLRELKAWELQSIGLQAASRIARSDNPMGTMQDVAQNFPIMASSLVREPVNASVVEEVAENQANVLMPLGIDAGDSVFMLNSQIIDPEKVDLFTILTTLRSDAKLLEGLRRAGIPSSALSSIVSISDGAAAHQQQGGFGGSGATPSTLDTRSSAVQYYNNLEAGKRYRRWPTDVMMLLRPAMPGTQRRIAKNLFTALVVLDPTTRIGAATLATIKELVENDSVVRFGFLFTSGRAPGGGGDVTYKFNKAGLDKSKKRAKTDVGVSDAEGSGNRATILLVRAFSYIKDTDGNEAAFSYLMKCAAKASSTGDAISGKRVKTEFVKLYGEDTWDSLKTKEVRAKVDKLLLQTELTIATMGLQQAPSADYDPVVFVNGDRVVLDAFAPAAGNDDGALGPTADPEVMETVLQQACAEQLPTIQRALYYGELRPTDDVLPFLYSVKPDVVKRLNTRISDLDKAAMVGFVDDNDVIKTLEYAETGAKAKGVTLLVAADFDTTGGQKLAFDALRRQLHDKKARVGLLSNANGTAPGPIAATLTGIFSAVAAHPGKWSAGALDAVGQALAKALNGETSPAALVAHLPEEMRDVALQSTHVAVAAAQGEYCQRHLRLLPGSAAVVANGHVLGPLGADEGFEMDDFKTLEKKLLTGTGLAAKLLRIVGKLKFSKAELPKNTNIVRHKSDVTMAVYAMVKTARASTEKEGRRVSEDHFQALEDEHTVVNIGLTGDALAQAELYHDVFAVLNPLSKEAQHIVPILTYIARVTSARVRVLLNPKDKISEAPLNRFYRTVVPDIDAVEEFPTAVFNKLPTTPLLTLGMHVPPAWLIQAFDCPYDLDNIHLDTAPNGVHAIFKLENILVQGRCYQDVTYRPPAGLQVELNTLRGTVYSDTIVMANLGYFQLKANPGAWQIGMREGRSSEIFQFSTLDSVDLTNGDDVAPAGLSVVLDSFMGKSLFVTVKKRAGMEQEELLQDDSETDGNAPTKKAGGLWDSLKSTFGGQNGNDDKADATSSGGDETAPSTDVTERVGETINVFSLASGHLYERFLKIMMLSVLKGTKNPVKFWFLKNCMSPQLVEFLPHMAKEYGFSYQLVQYKWPDWLNLPPTKHRQIWGYKILFLDVLFPLDVSKIIFVDADQVVRADLNELLEIDLEGAPYAYTPFCMDREEMDGFRFWKSGYWKNHLNGRPYHISALYVVDLVRFRQLAAGDRLREQYQGLSRDPNSLANLDQDLPNNMVHQVPIKSLPQEWLWCETWCSDDIKPQAKTIDLCNNPLTKEPKLEAAVRIVSEWTDLDYEARNVTRRIEDMLRAHSANVDDVTGDAARDVTRKDEL
eukprot:m.1095789 g.1095789  ORF g.1095789 m.1095789 type:complete len:1625 (+) comp24304_c0_seq1:77-4951(+)